MLIEDGKGGKGTAEVKDNMLQVAGFDEPLQAAINGDAYILHIDSITIDTADYLIALMINGDAKERDMVVTKVEIAAASTDDNAINEINLGGTFTTTVDNSTATTPFNQRSGCGKTAGGSYYVNDGSGDMETEANAYVAYAQKKGLKNVSSIMRVDGGWIVPYGCSISVSSTYDDKFYGCIHFYFRS